MSTRPALLRSALAALGAAALLAPTAAPGLAAGRHIPASTTATTPLADARSASATVDGPPGRVHHRACITCWRTV